jgi:hypothetical protein
MSERLRSTNSWFIRLKDSASLLLAREGPHDAHAGEVLLHARGDVAEVVLHRFRANVNALAEKLRQAADDRHREQRDERHHQIEAHHHHERAADDEQRGDRMHYRGTDQHAHRGEIVRGARHQIAGALPW